MRSRKALMSYMHELELKYIAIGIAIGLAIGYLQWQQGTDIVSMVESYLPL